MDSWCSNISPKLKRNRSWGINRNVYRFELLKLSSFKYCFMLFKMKFKVKNSSSDVKSLTYLLNRLKKLLSFMIKKSKLYLILQKTTLFQFINLFSHAKMTRSKTIRLPNLMIFGYSHMTDKVQTLLKELTWISSVNYQLWSKRTRCSRKK